SSEKIYFDKYFEDEIQNFNLRIIPTGGAKKIKRIYQNILTPYGEIKENIDGNTYNKWGKILFLSDTDNQLTHYEAKNYNNQYSRLQCYRLINNKSTRLTETVAINDSLTSPATEIEDCLNGKLLVETLKYFREIKEYEYLESIIDKDKEYSEEASYFSLNLRPSEADKLKEFFDSEDGDMKIKFAEKYVELMSQEDYQVPSWIEYIKGWIREP
ncbi:ATP-binding protein, partial [Neisseria gonorrhoeae]